MLNLITRSRWCVRRYLYHRNFAYCTTERRTRKTGPKKDHRCTGLQGENDLPVLAEIPFDRDLMICQASGIPVVRSGRYLVTFLNLLDSIFEAASSTKGESAEARKAGES